MRTRTFLIALAGAAAGLLPGCGGDDPDLVVYSGRNEELIKPFLDEFAEQNDVDVVVKFGDTPDIVGTVLEEGSDTRADVVIGQDAAALDRLREEGLLQPYDGLAETPERYRDPGNNWTGLSGRARVVAVRKGGERPDSVFDLADPRWKGRIAGPPPANVSFRDFVTAVRILRGDEFAEEYLAGLERNDYEVLSSHGEVVRAVAEGEFDAGLVNHYYVALHNRENGEELESVYTDQGRGDPGVVFNVASAGITAGADNPERARELLDYLLEPEVQQRFARANFEYPLLEGLEPASGVRPLDDFRVAEISFEELGDEAEKTDEILERVDLGG